MNSKMLLDSRVLLFFLGFVALVCAKLLVFAADLHIVTLHHIYPSAPRSEPRPFKMRVAEILSDITSLRVCVS